MQNPTDRTPAPPPPVALQVETPIRTTNRSLIKLTTTNGFKPEQVYEVRGV